MRKLISAFAVCSLSTLLPTYARACAVCFGSTNSNMSRAFFWGILLLLVIPFAIVVVLVGVIAYHTRKHHRQQAASVHSAS